MNLHQPRPVYLLAPGPGADALRAAFPGAQVVASPPALLAANGRASGLVVVERGAVPAEEVLALAEAVGTDGALVLASVDDGQVRVRPLSLGWATAADEATRWAESGGAEGSLPALGPVLAQVARARHDINNPLTSGLAETQLLLMDAPPDDETREALETIQTQLRRIRDMVADLRTLRPPE